MSTCKAFEQATFGMQCFWGSEAQFSVAPGVLRTIVGYTGGTSNHPTYKNIGDHTEAVMIHYDPSTITFQTLLSIFWSSHDPTELHKRQYISAIFFHDEHQKTLAEETMKEEQKRYRQPIVTEIKAFKEFYDAEDYHQKYYFRSHPELFKQIGVVDGGAVKQSTVTAKLNGFVGGYGTLEQFEKEAPNFHLNDQQLQLIRVAIKNAPKVRCH